MRPLPIFRKAKAQTLQKPLVPPAPDRAFGPGLKEPSHHETRGGSHDREKRPVSKESQKMLLLMGFSQCLHVAVCVRWNRAV